ncbi:hypothetical protein PCCS19_42870 [Paenibacillus sp. CCS19]|uniref:helix-turn-helix domain-containing protein n=1 Tax=Paenibacillus sp. CCS19 TaxID=3158387 RepID=UPI0025681AB2|nr:AraC family transcriptional regulator [Paenibacillus cellulosilyticus]GMK41231.1 hypothetical protein PCCS19_42870 [Paenibacillus cellulosilyticus]
MRGVLQKSASIYTPLGRLNPDGDEQHVVFQTYLPPDELTPFVDHFWTIAWNRSADEPYVSEQVMHRPYVDVFLSEQQSGIQCTFRDKRDYTAVDKGRIIGARLHPGAFHAFWGGSMDGLHNGTIPLQDVFAAADPAFIAHVLTLGDDEGVTVLAELIEANHPQMDPNIEVINNIIAAIEREDLQTVKEVAQWSGRSERWLQQLFQSYVGIGVKWQLQRNKLLAAARSIRDSDAHDWADLAYSHGYSSQQHFITDFKRVTGRTPLQYKKALDADRQTD